MEVSALLYKCSVCGTAFPFIPGILNSTKGQWPVFEKKPKCSFCGNYNGNYIAPEEEVEGGK